MSELSKDAELLLSLCDDLTPDDMETDILKWAAESIGVPAVVRLIVEYAGTPIYIPRSAKTHLKRQYVKRHFDGSNARDLALRFGLAERTIRDWVKQEVDAVQERLPL